MNGAERPEFSDMIEFYQGSDKIGELWVEEQLPDGTFTNKVAGPFRPGNQYIISAENILDSSEMTDLPELKGDVSNIDTISDGE